MMKSSKGPPKMHKSTRLSPMRKVMMKRPAHSSSMRMNVSSRPPLKHHLSPGMKRSPIMPPGKSMHSQRLRSIPSSPPRSLPRHSLQGSPMPLDRGHPMKSSKFEKRRHSPSPIRHPMTSSSHNMKEAHAQYEEDERYLGRPAPHDSRFSPPMKRKSRWEPDDMYKRGLSPSIRMHPSEMAHSENRMVSHRSGMPSHSNSVPSIPNPTHHNHMPISQHDRIEPYDMHRSHPSPLPVMAPSHSKRPSSSMSKSYKESHQERYRSPSPEDLYSSPKDKLYYSSLHERFSSVNNEPRVKYCLEELETITVDVHPPSIGSPRSRRHINSGGKVVRRENEGRHLSMFDRDEIKQAPRDMREEVYYEKSSSANISYGSMSVVKSAGKYEVRQKFDLHSAGPFRSTEGLSPSDRWRDEPRREATNMDRDHREFERTVKKRFVDSRSKSGDQDFRSEKFSRDASRERTGYHSPPHRMPSPDHRSNMPPIHRKDGVIQDARERLTARRGSGSKPHMSRSDSRGRYPSEMEKRFSDGLPSRSDKHYMDRRSPESHKWPPKHRSVSRERMPEYSHRGEKYPHKSWPEKRDLSPRSTDFHLEPDRYMESDSYRGRGGSRPFRSREQRGRGSFPPRSFRGGYRGSTAARGRGAPRRGRYSPGIWERDL